MKKIIGVFSLFVVSVFCAAQPGSLDTSFDPGTGTDSGGSVFESCIQPDGKILIGGTFTEYNGVNQKHLARLNTDGTLDLTFETGYGPSSYVRDIVLQPDGKILICGYLEWYDITPVNHIVRLNPDGSLDAGFNPAVPGHTVSAICLQPDGKIIISGFFVTMDGIFKNKIARLNPDGSLDNSFDAGLSTDIGITEMSLQPDGKIIITGSFTSFDGFSRNGIARLNSDGSLDTTFDPGSGANDDIDGSLILPDGKIILFGGFTAFNGIVCNYITKLNADGSIDPSFNTGTGANDNVWDLAYQPDGKILLCGFFTSFNSVSRKYIARLNSDGTLDNTFNNGIGPSSAVYSMALQTDGDIVIGGHFMYCDNISRMHIARLNKCKSKSQVYASTCDLYTVPSGDESYTISGIYSDTLINIYGCDSILSINLSMYYSSSAYINAAGCTDYIVPSGDETYTTDGIYVDTVSNFTGCDSIIYINLTLGAAYVSVSAIYEYLLKAEANEVSYQWLYCPSMQPVDGATGQYFSPEIPGMYAVAITDEFCSDTSLCYFAEAPAGLSDFKLPPVNVYPVPFNESITVSYDASIGNTSLKIYDQLGNLVYESNLNEPISHITTQHLPPGVYVLKVAHSSGVFIKQVVKN